MLKLIKLCILFYCGCSSAATLSYNQISVDKYLFILNNDAPLEIGQAKSAIYASAVELCNGSKPSLGKYSFSSSEPVSNGSEDSQFRFQQEVDCTGEAAIAARSKKLDLSNVEEENIKSTVKNKTDQFLAAKDAGEFRKAYDMLGSGMRSISEFPVWRNRESDNFGESLGKLISRDIWRITLYNNPSNSPKPGLYIAADYENRYEQSPIHCGYVMWFLPTVISVEYSVMREEYGSISKDMLKKIPQEKLQNVRKQVGCRAL